MMLHCPTCVQGKDADLVEAICSQELESRDGMPRQAPRAMFLSSSPPKAPALCQTQHKGLFPHCSSQDVHLHHGDMLPQPPNQQDFCLLFLKKSHSLLEVVDPSSQLKANPTLISQPKLKRKPTGLRIFGKQQRGRGRKDPGVDSRTLNGVNVTVLLHLLFSLKCFHHRLHPVSQKLS